MPKRISIRRFRVKFFIQCVTDLQQQWRYFAFGTSLGVRYIFYACLHCGCIHKVAQIDPGSDDEITGFHTTLSLQRKLVTTLAITNITSGINSLQLPEWYYVYFNVLASVILLFSRKICYTRMWANAQPDGRPAEHRWRPLFNAAKFV